MAASSSLELSIRDRLHQGLKSKGRRRRETLKATAALDLAAHRNDLLPTLVLQSIAVTDVVLPNRAVRRSDEVHVLEVAAAISAYGFLLPLLIGRDNRLVDGAIRVAAAKLLGLENVPCIRVEHLDAEQHRLLRLAVNRLAEKGTWDVDMLRLEFEELIVLDAPIALSGFSPDEVDAIIIVEDPGAVETGPLVPNDGAIATARHGDLFLLGAHRVLCGDATEPNDVRRLIGSEQVRLVLTDPPFNVRIQGHVTSKGHRPFAMASGEMSDAEFIAFNSRWMAAAKPHLIDGGLIASFIDWRGQAKLYDAAAVLGLALLNLIVWAKTNGGMGSLYRSAHELLPLFKSGTAPHKNNVNLGKRGRWRSNVWTYPGASSRGSDARRGLQDHPTVKPCTMLEDLILDVTDRDEIVLDPFLGSGSTLMAAEARGRVCRGVEIDPVYVDLIIRRWELKTGRKAVLEATGQTFDQLAEERGESPNPDKASLPCRLPAAEDSVDIEAMKIEGGPAR